MSNSQINPLLIELLTGNDIKVSSSPTISSLQGEYTRIIYKHKDSLTPIIEENYQMLTCKSCGRKGKYDVGMLVMNADKVDDKKETGKHIQTTGYFRCKHCNNAGNWEFPKDFLLFAFTSMLPIGDHLTKRRCTVGKNLLFDGSWHRYATDAEEHLLNLIKKDPQDAYVWNRLGNLYNRGNRPELAACVYEHSIGIDFGQVESHFTMGDMFSQINDLKKSEYHLHQMLLNAEAYQKMPAEQLREMLANGLRLLFLMELHTGEVSFLPSFEEVEASGRKVRTSTNLAEMEFEIMSDDVDSFFPLAEMYMGNRGQEIPARMRSIHLNNLVGISQRRKMEQKKKQRLRNKSRRK